AVVGRRGAGAKQGQPIDAGTVNTETKATVVNDTSVVVSNCIQYNDTGLVGCGGTGLDAEGTAFGVRAKANSTPPNGIGLESFGYIGVQADGPPNGFGVQAYGGTGVLANGSSLSLQASGRTGVSGTST